MLATQSLLPSPHIDTLSFCISNLLDRWKIWVLLEEFGNSAAGAGWWGEIVLVRPETPKDMPHGLRLFIRINTPILIALQVEVVGSREDSSLLSSCAQFSAAVTPTRSYPQPMTPPTPITQNLPCLQSCHISPDLIHELAHLNHIPSHDLNLI